VGNQSKEVPFKLRVYEQRIERLLAVAREHYAQVRLYIFSDHGMANCDEYLDLQKEINALDVKMGRDFAAVYDSTMARFWFFHEAARQQIIEKLRTIPQGRIVPEAELRALHAHFEDHHFGELIFLVKEGVLIVPSHMGERPIRAMHGYHPSDPQSYAALLTNQKEIPAAIEAIPDIYRLMTADAQLAHTANSHHEPDPVPDGIFEEVLDEVHTH
jgi:hypothetical protein